MKTHHLNLKRIVLIGVITTSRRMQLENVMRYIRSPYKMGWTRLRKMILAKLKDFSKRH